MRSLKRFFRKKKPQTSATPADKPNWGDIVATLYDKGLDAFNCEVVRVIYSEDRSIRYVILKDEAGRYTYEIEAIYQWYDDEWGYHCADDGVLPAQWEPFHGRIGNSFFDNEPDLLRELTAEPEYIRYFYPPAEK